MVEENTQEGLMNLSHQNLTDHALVLFVKFLTLHIRRNAEDHT